MILRVPYKNPERRRQYERDRRGSLRQYQREWYARRRAEWFADKSCVDCGSTDRLELDHVDPTQKVSHRVWSWSAARREAELAKCVVRCSDHHKAKSATEHLAGSALWNSRLTEDQVLDLRTRYAAGGVTFRELGAELGVHRDTVRKAVRYGWIHVGPPVPVRPFFRHW